MIDLEKLNPILEGYKAYFPSYWDDEKYEKYKWEAVKHFQDHWNIDAENFGDMFKTATDKTFNLLASGYAYPRGMITNFAKTDEDITPDVMLNLGGNQIGAKTLDLNKDFALIAAQLDKIAKDYFE